jgi:signal transduction histidine kinase
VASEFAAFRIDQADVSVPDLIVGLVWLGVGVGLWDRSRPAGVLSLGVAMTWFVGSLVPGAAAWHRAVLLGLLLAAPGWLPRSRPGRVLLVIGCAVVLVPTPWGDERISVLAAVVLVAGVAFERRTAGRLRGPMVGAAAMVSLSLVGGTVARSVVPDFGGVLPALLAYEAALVIAAGLVWFALARYKQQSTDLVVELGPAPAREVVADLLGDPDDPVLREALAVADQLHADHAALRREVADRIAEVAASRRRLVVAADEERAALENRLERGPERRLLRITELLDGLDGEHVVLARSYARANIAELRALARGLHPRQLSGGLGPALRALAATSPVPVTVVAPDVRVAPEVEVAAYFACAEALSNAVKHAEAHGVAVSARIDGPDLVVSVTDDGRGGADPAGSGLQGLRDRVEALDGRVAIASGPVTGTCVEVRMPTGAGG